ncbi:hypothetical protein [Arthrobacter pityocampae]|uniref:hypothetical protein n=1 Tax=Arthrobacter pityocampae TaxID=547334 RepID=UPI003735CF20
MTRRISQDDGHGRRCGSESSRSFAEATAERVRVDRPSTWCELRHEARHAAPIASTAATPTLLVIGALAGWWPTTAALLLAVAITVRGLVVLGWMIARSVSPCTGDARRWRR